MKKTIYLHTDHLDEETFGSKFANISKLSKCGVNVPPFFCLSPANFLEIFTPIKKQIDKMIEDIQWDDHRKVLEAADKIKELFQSQTLNDDLMKNIYRTFDNHLGEHSYVSVRSCVRANNEELKEDSADNAFAGMSESIMFLKREDLKSAILTCFSSCYSQQVLTYRHTLKLPHEGMEVVVGIQKMIRGSQSFIMFTKDPLDFRNQTIITCGYGTGEGIVQGKVETDHYLIDNVSASIEQKITQKYLKMDIDHNTSKGIKIYDVEVPKQNIACLRNEEIKLVWEVGQKIEAVQKYPQDIEGCFDENATLYILQSRPIVIDKDNITVWSSLNVSESYPGKSTPLTFTFAQNFYKTIFYDCYHMFGVSRKTLLQNEHALANMLGFLNGKIHYNLGNFYRLHGLSPLFPLFRKSWEEMIGLSMGYLIVSEKKASDRALSLIKGIFRTTVLFFQHTRNFKKFYVWWDDLFSKSELQVHEAHDNPLKLYKIFLHLWKEVESHWGVTLVNDVFMGITQTILVKLIHSSHLKDKQDELLCDLLCGGENPVSVEAMYSSLHMIKVISGNAEYKKLFVDNPALMIWDQIKNNIKFSELKNLCDKHLLNYGYRGLQELKLEHAPPRNKPETLIELLQGQLSNAAHFKDMSTDDKMRRKEAENYLESKLGRFSPTRKLILYLSNILRDMVVQRENSRYCRSELFGVSREIYMEIAKSFVKDDIIEKADDIYFCTYREIEEMILGTNSLENLKATVAIRKKDFESFDDEFERQTFSTVGPVYFKQFPKKEEHSFDARVLRGLGSSNGIVTGKARIVINPDPSIKLHADEILVAKETDPGWLFLMVNAKGMIVERGSMLSHTAITGRKLGIPTVVAVPNATQIIKDGDQITLNGSSGIITIDERK